MVQSSSFIFASREPPAASSHHITSIVLRITPLTPCASQPTIFLYFHGCLCLLFSSKIDHSSRSAFSTSFHFRRPTFPSLAVVHRFSLSHSLKIVSRSVLSFFCVVFKVWSWSWSERTICRRPPTQNCQRMPSPRSTISRTIVPFRFLLFFPSRNSIVFDLAHARRL